MDCLSKLFVGYTVYTVYTDIQIYTTIHLLDIDIQWIVYPRIGILFLKSFTIRILIENNLQIKCLEQSSAILDCLYKGSEHILISLIAWIVPLRR